MNTIATYKTNIQRDLLYQVILHMKRQELSTPSAQRLAQEFLLTLKSTTIEEFLDELAKLARKYKEIDEVFTHYAKDFEETVVNERLMRMSQLIASNDIEMALKAGRGET
jgi:hypothetical protein